MFSHLTLATSTQTLLAVYVKILYRIGVSSRRIRLFGSVDKSENATFAFLCVQPICIFCEMMISIADYMLAFVLQELLSLLALLTLLVFLVVVLGLYTAYKSSPFLVYLYGRITAPHTGSACILHSFESVSVVLCVHIFLE